MSDFKQRLSKLSRELQCKLYHCGSGNHNVLEKETYVVPKSGRRYCMMHKKQVSLRPLVEGNHSAEFDPNRRGEMKLCIKAIVAPDFCRAQVLMNDQCAEGKDRLKVFCNLAKKEKCLREL